MTTSDSFRTVFQTLKSILQDYEEALQIVEDKEDSYVLNTPYAEHYRKELFFGAAQIKKNYVSYHLMPVYMYTDLLDGLPDRTKSRMHGKSCFNFTSLTPEHVEDLSKLTKNSFERLHTEGLVRAST